MKTCFAAAAVRLAFAASAALLSVSCGGKLGGGESSDGGSASSGGSSGSAASSSSGGGAESSSSSGGGGCTPLPGCPSNITCPDPNGCGSCSCSGGAWTCVEDHSCFDASPATCPANAPAPGSSCPAEGLQCSFMPPNGCPESCTCVNGGWSCPVYPCTMPPPPPPSCGLYGLDVPDAAVGDAGATLPECYACLEMVCAGPFARCNADCPCSASVLAFLNCLAQGSTTVSCGTSLASGGDQSSIALLQCAAGPFFPGGTGPGCLPQCGAAPVPADASAGD